MPPNIRFAAWPKPPDAGRACCPQAHPTCRSALISDGRRPSFCRRVLCAFGDAERRRCARSGALHVGPRIALNARFGMVRKRAPQAPLALAAACKRRCGFTISNRRTEPGARAVPD